MDEEHTTGRREERSGSPRSSQLPRRGPRRRPAPLEDAQEADLGSVSRKSSQTSTPTPEIGSPVETESRRDKVRGHRREPSSVASQESFDPPSPRTPPPPTRAPATKGNTLRIVQDDHYELRHPESPTRKQKVHPSPSTVSQEVPGSEAVLASQIPRAAGQKTKSPRMVYRKNSPRKSATGSMADETEKGSRPENPIEKETEKSSTPDAPMMPQQSEKEMTKEESYVQINEPSNPPADGQEIRKVSLPSKINGSEVRDHSEEKAGTKDEAQKILDQQSQVQGGVSYSNVLKSASGSEDDLKGQDDDSSYPDLDDMTVDEVHPAPPSNPNGGIRWAPWDVPYKRRAQTLVVLTHSLCIVATVSIFFALCANPFAWPLLLIYLLHVLSSKAATDGSLRFRAEWFRRSYWWHLFAGYFPARLHKTHDLPPTRKYIFGYHPHGIISHGAWAAFATDALGFSEKFPGITNSLLTLDSNFRIPFYREYVLGMGVRSVSKESIVNILTKGGSNGEGMGRGVTVVIGGARESLEAEPGMLRLILKERKGFIKLAVRCGADIVPVLAFGENALYDQLRPREHPLVHKLQMFILKVWKFTLPFLHGRGIFNYDVGLMPYRRPLNVVVGAPIKVRQSDRVVPEEINRLHHLYVQELEKLWDRYKDEFAPDRKEEMQILP
ncbi:diacylglycerol acyltransferase-domain-containing protein [Xylariaceae sp. FL0016]|nr:diacylglycerol acyltransferase-domain-containing protein [Xylariaceae sp. FL0016]